MTVSANKKIDATNIKINEWIVIKELGKILNKNLIFL